MLIIGDIGGTSTRLALVEPGAEPGRYLLKADYASGDYPTLAPIVRHFMASSPTTASAACFCVAGPVVDGRARLTNLPWDLSEETLAHDLGLGQVTLLNDLQAVAYAIPSLAADDIHAINTGRAVRHGPIAVIAPGTGLGEAFLIWTGERYVACASEGGHTDFAPTNERQARLLSWMSERHEHVGYERVCSGSALPDIYDFVRSLDPSRENPALATAMRDTDDASPLIVAAGMDDSPDPIAAEALDLVIEIWSAEAGNLALKTLATGGVYLAGGMPMRLLSRIRVDRFMQSFTAKGRFAGLLGAMPVHVVKINAGLLGATQFGLAILAQHART